MSKRVGKFIYWAPRIISIIFILFLALFSLDIFGNDYSFWETVIGLFMHNIPVIILTVLLIIAWKHEIVGAIAFFLAGLAYTAIVLAQMFRNGFEWYYFAWIAQISGIAFLVGILFLIGWIKKKK